VPPNLGGTPGKYYDTLIGGTGYYIQMNWDLDAGGYCAIAPP
jgi:hypothetical protein